MIILRRATETDFVTYKYLYENTERWLLTEESKWLYLYHLTQYRSKESIEELKKFLQRFKNYTVDDFTTDLSREWLYMYFVETEEKPIGFVEIDYMHTLFEVGQNGRRYKASSYHINDSGLMQSVTDEQRIEVIKQTTELNLPLMHDIQVWADSDMARVALEANGFYEKTSGFYHKTWTQEEMQARKKRKRKG